MDFSKKKLLENKRIVSGLLVICALVLAATLKIWLVLSDVLPFNSDEAVVALMARHILNGSKPIFFYGQAYMGSLDAWLVAFGFWIFGQHVWVIRLIQGILYLGVLVTTFKLGKIALGSKLVGIIAIWLLAIPNVIVTLYTTVSLGGYGEALLIGNFILILGLQISESIKNAQSVAVWRWWLWGFIVGLGLWVFGLTLVYSTPMALFLLFRIWNKKQPAKYSLLSLDTWKSFILIFLGVITGAVPFFIYALNNGINKLFSELGGSAVAVEQTHWLLKIGQHIGSLILFGSTAVFGMRPSWEFQWLGLPLLPVALTFWVGVLFYILTRFKVGRKNRFGAGVLAGMLIVLSIGFVFSSFGVDPSGRYFVPLIIPLSLFAGEMILYLVDRYGKWVWSLLGVIMIYNLWGIYQSANKYPPGITTQFNQITQVDQRKIGELINFLNEHGETTGYSNYWVAYPLAFLSEEELIFIPRLPYHENMAYTSRDDRYETYDQIVESASRAAYITTHHPKLNDYLRDKFIENELTWSEHKIGDFHVFYDLSDVITPEDLDMGVTTP